MANAPPTATVDQALAILETYQRQIEALSRQIQFLQSLHDDNERAREALEGLRKEPANEILVPLGANTFIHAQATRKDKALTGIGAGLSVEKTWAEAEKRLADRDAEIRGEMERLGQAGMRLQQEAAALEDEIQSHLPPGARA
jgi:prefoldin alpha subunit